MAMYTGIIDGTVCGEHADCYQKGKLVYTDLCEEYKICFRRVIRNDADSSASKWKHAVAKCLESALWIAMSSRMPMVHEQLENFLSNAHVVLLGIATVFLEHLQETWFGLDNHRLASIRQAVNRHLTSKRKALQNQIV